MAEQKQKSTRYGQNVNAMPIYLESFKDSICLPETVFYHGWAVPSEAVYGWGSGIIPKAGEELPDRGQGFERFVS